MLSSSHNDALNDIAIQRFRPFNLDPIEALSQHFIQTTLQSEQHQNKEEFWILPDEAASITKDPELL